MTDSRPNPLVCAGKLFISVLTSIAWLSGVIICSIFSKRLAFSLMNSWASHQRDLWGISLSLDDRNSGNYRGPHLFVNLNQTSLTETLLFHGILKEPYFVFANVEYLMLPFLGWSTWALGAVVVIRQWKEQARGALDVAKRDILGGWSCYMSVEGKRSRDGSLSNYKKGAAVLGIETGVPIVPVVYKGARNCLPFGEWRVRPGKVQVVLCEKIDTSNMKYEDRAVLTQRLRQIAEKELYGGGAAPQEEEEVKLADRDIELYAREFSYIQEKTAHLYFNSDYSSAVLPFNREKNRYSDILAPEETRVKLAPVKGVYGSDYINANFISGNKRKNVYIATQGPTPKTIEDFWRMVWEQGVSVVVMLTKVVENGKVRFLAALKHTQLKCETYWPEDSTPSHFGRFSVSLETESEGGELKLRRLILTNNSVSDLEAPTSQTQQTRRVAHFQYTSWPDFGIPPKTSVFLELVSSVNSENTDKAPIVVHCSAGVGRSGTFCAVHSTLEDFQGSNPAYDIATTVMKMREQRTGMVQTKEQYMFCHLAIKEAIHRMRKPAASAQQTKSVQ